MNGEETFPAQEVPEQQKSEVRDELLSLSERGEINIQQNILRRKIKKLCKN